MNDSNRVLVIGSGPAGAAAAHQLVASGIPVTMLESGTERPKGFLLRLMERNIYRSVPKLERVATQSPDAPLWFRNLAPGGLSNQWTGAVPRFAPADFTEGERLHPKYRWPVQYAEMERYYDCVERLIGVRGDSLDVPGLPAGTITYPCKLPPDWQRIATTVQKSGQGLTSMPLADGPPFLITRRGTAFNSFTNIIQPLLKSPLFQLRLGAHVLRLEWSPIHQRVKSVVVVNRQSGVQERLECAAVVVACGALQSTKLLFDSACADFPNGLGNVEGLLGKYLHDHPKEWWVCDSDRPLTLLASAAYLTRQPYASSPPLLATSWTIGVIDTKDRIRSRANMKGTGFSVQVFGTMIPEERYFVAPSSDRKDEFGLPALDIHLHFDEATVRNVEDARQRFCDLLGNAGYRATLRPVEPQMIPGNAVHYGGTIRMHESSKLGMVDSFNRLYEVPNVLVCDASCFTTGAEKNPTLTIMAIAARAADRLAHDLKTSDLLVVGTKW